MKVKGGGRKKTVLSQNNSIDFEMRGEAFDAGNDESVDVNRENREIEDGGQEDENDEVEQVVIEEEQAVMGEEQAVMDDEQVVIEEEQAVMEEEQGAMEDEEEEEEEEDAQEDRQSLGEGFYEVEAVRRRRIRKGQLQYLIKWRGWPETANTWEPLENLQTCSEVVEAFDRSLRSGKSSRKRKRKSGGSLSLLKKKQPLSGSTSTAYNGTVGFAHSPSYVPLTNTCLLDFPIPTQIARSVFEAESNGYANNVKTATQTNENILANGSKQIDGRKEEMEYDPKLSELKGITSTNEVHADKLALHFQETKASESNDPTHSKVDCVEPVQSDRRTGARRRKSGSVKRFKQDSAASKVVSEPCSTPSFAFGCSNPVEQLGIGDSTYMNKIDGSRNAPAIVKLLKTIHFSASVSGDEQDVVVTFEALSSDGRQVIVDNKFLKDNDPLPLINYYEQNLKYNAP